MMPNKEYWLKLVARGIESDWRRVLDVATGACIALGIVLAIWLVKHVLLGVTP